jgi:hypothetical protein
MMMNKKLTAILVSWLVAGVAGAFPLDPVRIYYADIAPQREGPVKMIFTVWQGGDQKHLGSGKLLYKEEATVAVTPLAKEEDKGSNPKESKGGYVTQGYVWSDLDPNHTESKGRFYGWLGGGTVLGGKLKGDEFGLDKVLYVKIEFPEQKDTHRWALCAIDNA